jgi:hypothetical protein
METFYMNTISGDVATKEEWKSDYESMDRESWFGESIEECHNKDWLSDQKYLVEVYHDGVEWSEVQ